MKVLVVDIGGSHVKIAASEGGERRKFPSGREMGPEQAVERVLSLANGWRYDVVSVGFPGKVDQGCPAGEPGNLGRGWVGFDFGRAFGKPVRVVNDAVLQALGGYDGGRMLFLGLGTGLGSALVTERVVVPLELGRLPFAGGENMADRLGRAGFETHGHARWVESVGAITAVLRDAFAADYVVLGGGNAKRVDPLPPCTRRGGNDDAIKGGFRLWEEMIEPMDGEAPAVWRVVR